MAEYIMPSGRSRLGSGSQIALDPMMIQPVNSPINSAESPSKN